MAISYVGGQTAGRAGATTTSTVTFALTGGPNSTPQAGDLVVITAVVGSQARNPAQAISGYTGLGQLNPTATTYDTSLNVSYKRMGGTPDTTFTLPSTGNVADAQRYTVQVFRGVDAITPLDVAAVAASGTATGRPNPGSITPATAGAWVVICGGGAAAAGAAYTAPANFTTNFLSGRTADTNDAMVGSGYWSGWTSGAVDPGAYTGGTTGANDSWAAYTIALRPAPPAPSFTVQPTNQSASVGATATFSATVSDATTYQWQSKAPGGGGVWSDVSTGTGGTTDSHTTATLVLADDGTQYRLNATGTGGTTTSNEVTLTVTSGSGTTFTITPSGNITLSGTTATGKGRRFTTTGTLSLTGTSTQLHSNVVLPIGTLSFVGTSGLSLTKNILIVPTGNLVLQGTAPIVFSNGSVSYTLVPTGLVILSGTNTFSKGKVFSVSGSLSLSGTSVQQHSRVLIPSGQIQFIGDTLSIQSHVYVPNGVIVFGGTAPITFSGTIPSTEVSIRLPTTFAGTT